MYIYLKKKTNKINCIDRLKWLKSIVINEEKKNERPVAILIYNLWIEIFFVFNVLISLTYLFNY
jgi:hypothetical protein